MAESQQSESQNVNSQRDITGWVRQLKIEKRQGKTGPYKMLCLTFDENVVLEYYVDRQAENVLNLLAKISK